MSEGAERIALRFWQAQGVSRCGIGAHCSIPEIAVGSAIMAALGIPVTYSTTACTRSLVRRDWACVAFAHGLHWLVNWSGLARSV